MSLVPITFERWWRDESGLEAVEIVLLLAALVVPLIAGMLTIATLLGKFYAYTSWVISLPFP